MSGSEEETVHRHEDLTEESDGKSYATITLDRNTLHSDNSDN